MRNSIGKGDFVLVEFLIRGDRAVLCPMYKGTHERRFPTPPDGEKARRDLQVQMFKDLCQLPTLLYPSLG
jgi:hypothetical protein